MTDQVETYLREQFAADARLAPVVHDLADGARGQVRRQRRRNAGVLVVALTTLTIAAGAGLLARTGPDKADPTKPPLPSATPSEAFGSAARPLTYAVGRTIHWGDRTIDAGREVSQLALTDDGVVVVGADGKVWFTDGQDPVLIGSSAYGSTRNRLIESANEGSIVVWWESADDRRDVGQLVVYDTAGRRIVGRIRGDTGPIVGIPRLEVYDDFVYWTSSRRVGGPLARYEVSTGDQSEVSMASHEADRRDRPDSLIVDTAQRDRDPLEEGTYESSYFRRVGSRLVGAHSIDVGHDVPVQPRVRDDVWVDTRTGKPLPLRLPRGYSSTDAFAVTQWIDDDRVAMFANYDGWSEVVAKRGDIFICRLSRGRCVLVVDAASTDRDAAGRRIGFVVPGNPFS